MDPPYGPGCVCVLRDCPRPRGLDRPCECRQITRAPLTPGRPLSEPCCPGLLEGGLVALRPADTSGAWLPPRILGAGSRGCPRPACLLAAAPGGPAVCLPALVMWLFVLLSSGVEEYESMGLDSSVKNNVIETQFTCRTVCSERHICRAVVFSVFTHVCTTTTGDLRRFLPAQKETPHPLALPSRSPTPHLQP